jgi:23S rRNA (uridine2552-2'-O)-methyltransferase
VIDLGAAPGGFLQIIARAVGPSGWVLGVDLVPIATFPEANIKTLQGNLLEEGFDRVIQGAVQGRRPDLVTSDMAPKTSGVRTVDESRSLELCRMALEVAKRHLKPGGAFVCKVFMGQDFKEFEREVRKAFAEAQIIRPKATRERSIEVYVVGKGFRGPPGPQ